MTTLILAATWFSGCATLPATPDQAATDIRTRELTPAPATPATSATRFLPSPSATLSPPATPIPTETPLPTEPPLAVSDPELGYDCSQVERLPVASPEAQRLAEALVASYKEKLPTEYIAIEDLWAVDRLGKYVLIQMRVTDEAAGVFVLGRTPASAAGATATGTPAAVLPAAVLPYEYLASQVWGGWPLPSRHTFPEYFTAQLPDAPPELFYCMSLDRFFFEIQAGQELDLTREYDCSPVVSILPDSPEGWAISQALRAYWAGVIEVLPVELDQVHAIQQAGSFIAIQARFRVGGRLEPPEIFIAEETDVDYRFIAQSSGGGPDQLYLLRHLYAQDPAIPPGLLACLALDGWLLEAPTPLAVEFAAKTY